MFFLFVVFADVVAVTVTVTVAEVVVAVVVVVAVAVAVVVEVVSDQKEKNLCFKESEKKLS